MKRINITISICLLVFAAFFAWQTARLPTRNLENTLGIDFMPWVLVVALTLLASMLLIQNLVLEPRDEGCDYPLARKEGIGILGLLVTVIAYMRLMRLFGFLLITPLAMAVILYMTGMRRPITIAVTSLLITCGVYIFFQILFQVQLPRSRFF